MITDLKQSKNFPPNFHQIKKYLGNPDAYRPVFCYGNVIYNPYNREITPDIEVHEYVHFKQQGTAIEAWHQMYLTNPDFRLSQEIEAYGVQFAFARRFVKDRKILDWVKTNLAEALSGEMYGNLLTLGEAESKIRQYAKKEGVKKLKLWYNI